MMDKFKLCLVAPVPPPYGGISNWVMLLKKHIDDRNDIAIDIVSTAPTRRNVDGRTLLDRVVIQGLSIFKKCSELKKIIREKHPDVVHITTSGQLSIIRDIVLLRIAKQNGIPTVYHIRFGRIKDISDRKTVEWILISKAMRVASSVIAIDRTTYEVLRKYHPNVKVVYIPNPIDLSKMPEPEKGDNKVAMYLGWIIKTKGIEELLTAWKNIRSKHVGWQLKLVGPYKDDYYAYLKSSYSFDGVVFEGEKDHNQAMELLNNSEIFLLPSYTEGFPNVVLEAMALKKPVIATAVGAIPDMLSNNCGRLINVKNTDDLELAIDELISDSEKRDYLSENAHRKLMKEYSIENVFNQYMKIWQEI